MRKYRLRVQPSLVQLLLLILSMNQLSDAQHSKGLLVHAFSPAISTHTARGGGQAIRSRPSTPSFVNHKRLLQPENSVATSTTSSPSTTTSLSAASPPFSQIISFDDFNHDNLADDANNVPLNSKTFQFSPPSSDFIPLQNNQRLVCFGDVHGDFTALETFLEVAEVYDPSTGLWIGNDTIVVQCGDVLDRGSEELQSYALLASLSQQAQRCGGQLIPLWGNHEVLNAVGMFQYTTGDDEYERWFGESVDRLLRSEDWRIQFNHHQPSRWAAYEPGLGFLAQSLLGSLRVAVRVGNTLCVHGGLTAQQLDHYGGLPQMNREARTWAQTVHHDLNNLDGDYPNEEALRREVQLRQQKSLQAMPECLKGGIGSVSPLWMRDFSQPNDIEPQDSERLQQVMDTTLLHIGADRMVMGHTPQDRINAALGGTAWRVDVGASKGVNNGAIEVLEIVNRDGDEIVSVLTRRGRIPESKRQAMTKTAETEMAQFL